MGNKLVVFINVRDWEKVMYSLESGDYELLERYTFETGKIYDAIIDVGVEPDIIISDTTENYYGCEFINSATTENIRKTLMEMVAEQISEVYVLMYANANGLNIIEDKYKKYISKNGLCSDYLYRVDVFNDFVCSDRLHDFIRYCREMSIYVNILVPNKKCRQGNICADIIYQNARLLEKEISFNRFVNFVKL